MRRMAANEEERRGRAVELLGAGAAAAAAAAAPAVHLKIPSSVLISS